jgi:hypothetical protein
VKKHGYVVIKTDVDPTGHTDVTAIAVFSEPDKRGRSPERQAYALADSLNLKARGMEAFIVRKVEML